MSARAPAPELWAPFGVHLAAHARTLGRAYAHISDACVVECARLIAMHVSQLRANFDFKGAGDLDGFWFRYEELFPEHGGEADARAYAERARETEAARRIEERAVRLERIDEIERAFAATLVDALARSGALVRFADALALADERRAQIAALAARQETLAAEIAALMGAPPRGARPRHAETHE